MCQRGGEYLLSTHLSFVCRLSVAHAPANWMLLDHATIHSLYHRFGVVLLRCDVGEAGRFAGRLPPCQFAPAMGNLLAILPTD